MYKDIIYFPLILFHWLPTSSSWFTTRELEKVQCPYLLEDTNVLLKTLHSAGISCSSPIPSKEEREKRNKRDLNNIALVQVLPPEVQALNAMATHQKCSQSGNER